MAEFQELHQVDQNLQDITAKLINHLWDSRTTQSDHPLIMGGSTVEGAMVARYFQAKDGKTVTKEVEVDNNILLATIPRDCQHLLEEIPDKLGKLRILANEELVSLIGNEVDRKAFVANQHSSFVDSFIAKESVAGTIVFRELEDPIKEILATAMKKNVEEIKLIPYGQVTKASTATDVEVIVSGDLFVQVSMDLAVMFEITWWPKLAGDWIGRSRNWPSDAVIGDLTKHCFVIAKPSDDEKEKSSSTEMTYSFHHAEASLAILRSHKQRFVYLVYKSLVYKYIKPIDPETIPSFWGKTVMLWLCEQHPPDNAMWDDIISMLKHMFNSLLSSLQQRNLSYFFVPEINLLETLDETLKEKVEDALIHLIENIENHIMDLPVLKAVEYYQNIYDISTKIYQQLLSNGNNGTQETGRNPSYIRLFV